MTEHRFNPDTQLPREFTEEQDMEDIKRMHEVIDSRVEEDGITTLAYGSKTLEIYYPHKLETGEFDTDTITDSIEADEEIEKKLHETRILYMAAKRLVQGFVNKTERAFTYHTETVDPKMVSFLLDHGNNIFDWDEKSKIKFRPDGDVTKEQDIWTFTKQFKPE